MTEWHFPSEVHTFEFHEHRERAPHLEQGDHRARLLKTAELVEGLCDRPYCCGDLPDPSVVDLGCGDGGLLSLLHRDIFAWGYDFAPSNVDGWAQRGVDAESKDVFNDPAFPDNVHLAEVVVLTEVLEHLMDPHWVLRQLRGSPEPQYVVASSPRFETDDSHGDCHQWAWDWEGYEDLFGDSGWRVKHHEAVDWSQILVAER